MTNVFTVYNKENINFLRVDTCLTIAVFGR